MFIHGGLTATGKSNSLYRINLKTFRSKCCSIVNPPGNLAMHKMVLFDDRIFLFGGLNEENIVSDELWELSPTNEHWTQFKARKVVFETKPTPRLAFNFHVLNLPIAPKTSQNSEQPTNLPGTPNIQPIDDWKVTIDGANINPESSESKVDVSGYSSTPVLFIHGGCDAEGEFFNDLYVAAIPPKAE
ncbi:Oidioi.mRNA.OKI2018_I69.PAR.g13100.t2.cds [Oikopleura dioica]|nr:Oidioi.mRNA.OKI2018_I69.PAR.g13100.t2.cds [Oikopleura dioica]